MLRKEFIEEAQGCAHGNELITKEPVESILTKPDLGTKQDEQHPNHGEYRGD
jgi:hypothetical protein